MEKSILILVPVYVAYIITLGLMMFSKRLKAIKTKQIKLHYFKDYTGETPSDLQIYKNHFDNQFQFPILFIIACVVISLTKKADLLSVVLCYVFFISRLFHSYFHLGSNDLRLRATSYFIGAITVLVIWINFIISYLS